MKKLISIMLTLALLITMSVPVHAEECTEWYQMVFEEEGSEIDQLFDSETPQIMPRSKYIMGVQTTAKYLGSNQVAIRVDAYCNSTMKSITSIFYLQKYVNGTWYNVSSGTISVSSSNKLSKTGTLSQVASGTYRAKSVTKVTDYNGYSESINGYSGSFSI